MKRIAIVFLLAIVLPSILLAGLTARLIRDQAVVVNSQRVQLFQSKCDSLVSEINLFMDEIRAFHGQLVNQLVERHPNEIAWQYGALVQDGWTQAYAGAVVDQTGAIVGPAEGGSQQEAQFLKRHCQFLKNESTVEVYQAPPLLNSFLNVIEETDDAEGAIEVENRGQMRARKAETTLSIPEPLSAERRNDAKSRMKVQAAKKKQQSLRFEPEQKYSEALQRAPMPVEAAGSAIDLDQFQAQELREIGVSEDNVRNVAPTAPEQPGWDFSNSQVISEGQVGADAWNPMGNRSQLSPATLKLDQITEAESGAVSRIIEGNLHVLLWEKTPAMPGLTFWTELDLTSIQSDLADLFVDTDKTSKSEVSLALLDTNGKMVCQTQSGFSADWTRPFVAAEVGQILPRWEVAAYFLDPSGIDRSEKLLRWTLWLIVSVLLVAVVVGTVLILKAVRYEMQLAMRKTDFVSNVSHELKTPLTSIRMFSELLARGEKVDPDKSKNYSGIIHKESERLSRLINRLLDFSRLDRNEVTLKSEPVNLRELLQESLDTFRLQLEESDMTLDFRDETDEALTVMADRDAMEQVVLNLLCNANKHAASGEIIEVELDTGPDKRAIIRVMDRGKGVPRALREKIFEKFYRIEDSIHSGVEGSGIGLALCRQLMEKQGGSIRYEPRRGGGSVFIVEMETEMEL